MVKPTQEARSRPGSEFAAVGTALSDDQYEIEALSKSSLQGSAKLRSSSQANRLLECCSVLFPRCQCLYTNLGLGGFSAVSCFAGVAIAHIFEFLSHW